MRNLTPEKAFRLKKQNIFELNFSEEPKSNKIHSRYSNLQPQETLFSAYTKNRVIKLKETHQMHTKIQSLKSKLIRIFKDNRQQSPHDMFTDQHGKLILEELKESHVLNMSGLQRMVNSSEKNPFFLNQPRHSSGLRKCYFRYPTDAIEKFDRSTAATPQPLVRRYTPMLKQRVRNSEQWNELNAWQTKDESTTNLF
ncbi:unnamed protein product (macronuclear) [Paramecium tetraurelia]|uniref:Uncharacterized protein n=1 Tax=Paramecium tetraurelia TaxID=5888 RepID=A0CX12_PARTE|nr:uncharacterized protein GSPATT00001532001 [Paramecium tetraurelia]CAK75329.1 unnamed protein product [Paramecium tetraurelia]|eukprot:XP_001442726.1 hypothetical protein (macronuclear) [Paramecium tetraurelia strain d4-2]